MLFLLDVDGVVADLTAHIYLVSGTDLRPEDRLNWDFLQDLSARENYLAKFFMQRAGFWSQLPVIDGAIEGVQAIRDAGHDIHWVTSPWESCREWGYQRKLWLKEHFQAKPKDVTITRAKYLIAGDVLIDDKVENVEYWRAQYPKSLGLLYRAPHVVNNKPYYGEDWGEPTFSWGEIKKLLESLDA